jgi:hypothetical protein
VGDSTFTKRNLPNYGNFVIFGLSKFFLMGLRLRRRGSMSRSCDLPNGPVLWAKCKGEADGSECASTWGATHPPQ